MSKEDQHARGFPAWFVRQREQAQAAVDREVDTRRVLSARAMLGEAFTIDAVVERTKLDVATVEAALRLYDEGDDD
jgi:hypothetical protein